MNRALSTLTERLGEMTPAERRIAQCILEAPEAVVNETITHLARRAGTSLGSVANFAASMGFGGFSDMKIRIAQDLGSAAKPVFDGVAEGDDPRAAMQKIAAAAQTAFRETCEAMDDGLLRAAQLLMSARRIEIYAAGSSLPVGQDAHFRLMRLGLPAVFVADPLLAGLSAAQLTEADAVLAVSHKGRTTSVLASARTAAQRGAKVVALTSYRTGPLAQMSDVTLLSVSGEAEAYREGVVSRLAQLLIVDSLCAYIAAQRGAKAVESLDKEIELLEQYRTGE